MTLLEALRAETRSIHEALHVHPLLAPLNRPDVTAGQYGAALTAFDACYRAMESRRTVPAPVGVPDAPVVDWLARDMAMAGVRPLSPAVDWPAIDNEARLWGYLYVKQGSTLGGAVMSKNLKRALGLRPGTEQLFFAGYGAETGVKWKEFIENLFRKAPSLPQTEVIEMAWASFQAIAATCDAVHSMKSRDAVQTAPATLRKPAQGRP
jgi:heme oxygenase